mgnify:FL=1
MEKHLNPFSCLHYPIRQEWIEFNEDKGIYEDRFEEFEKTMKRKYWLFDFTTSINERYKKRYSEWGFDKEYLHMRICDEATLHLAVVAYVTTQRDLLFYMQTNESDEKRKNMAGEILNKCLQHEKEFCEINNEVSLPHAMQKMFAKILRKYINSYLSMVYYRYGQHIQKIANDKINVTISDDIMVNIMQFL